MSGKAYRRGGAKTAKFDAEVPMFNTNPVGEEYYEIQSSGSNWEYYLMIFILILAGGALLFSIMGWHESRNASDFAYNAEAYAKYHKLRDNARRTCLPLYAVLAVSDIPASIIISDWINQNLSPADHRALCLFIADPPAPSPPPVMIAANDQPLASDESHQEHPPHMSISLPEELCAYFEGFPFEKICVEEHEPYIIRAICSCAPEPEMHII